MQITMGWVTRLKPVMVYFNFLELLTKNMQREERPRVLYGVSDRPFIFGKNSNNKPGSKCFCFDLEQYLLEKFQLIV